MTEIEFVVIGLVYLFLGLFLFGWYLPKLLFDESKRKTKNDE